MRKFAIAFLVCFAGLAPAFGFSGISARDVKDKMMLDLDIIQNTFDVKYAPADWKKNYAEWDLQNEIDLAKVKVLETPNITVKDYQRILQQFFNSTKDYHVGVSFYSTETAVLPFRIHSAKGKYYIAWVLGSMFDGLKDPIEKGDEVLLFNGRPIDEAVQALKASDFGNPGSLTDQALAESSLTMRSGSMGHLVPKGPVTVTVRHLGTDEVTTYRLNWLYYPEEITSSFAPIANAPDGASAQKDVMNYVITKSLFQRPLGEHPFFVKDMTAPMYRNFAKSLSRAKNLFKKEMGGGEILAEEEDRFIGSKESFVPTLGEVVWQAPATSPYHAYIYLDKAGRKIGYIRIPHYMAGGQSAEQFAEIMNYFQHSTEALVVDQLNNPGGNLFYMYALASMLTDKPLLVPKQKMTITQEDVYFALDDLNDLEEVMTDEDARNVLGSNLAGYPADLELARGIVNYFRFIINEWNEGRQLTELGYVYGIDYLKPHPKGYYAKPILMLVNELDFSCADFLPAILQDNHRVKILGTRTAGAGGYVLSHAYPNLFGIQGFSYTGSIAHRADNNPIENLGVTPEVIVELTAKDLERNYPDYMSEIHKAVFDLLD